MGGTMTPTDIQAERHRLLTCLSLWEERAGRHHGDPRRPLGNVAADMVRQTKAKLAVLSRLNTTGNVR